MREFKGTKGKWEAKDLFNNWLIVDENDNLVEIRANKANALLISKAPEMLEMLNHLIEDEQLSSESIIEEVKQLIKEATELNIKEVSNEQ